jgi:hypothetical protein
MKPFLATGDSGQQRYPSVAPSEVQMRRRFLHAGWRMRPDAALVLFGRGYRALAPPDEGAVDDADMLPAMDWCIVFQGSLHVQ